MEEGEKSVSGNKIGKKNDFLKKKIFLRHFQLLFKTDDSDNENCNE